MSDPTSSPSLPPDTPNQQYVSVKPIVAGKIRLPLRIALYDYRDQPDDVAITAPAFAFLITHPERGHVLFDLGIRKHCEGYPPVLHNRMHDVFQAVCEDDVADQLRKGGVRPDDIGSIILSHVHWDHIGDSSLFPNAEIVLGGGTKPLLSERVYPENPEGRMCAFPEGHELVFVDFDFDSVDSENPSFSNGTRFKRISPFATFDRAVDFFGDGSLYLIDTPGHMPGHQSALARIASGVFMFLAGDLCHHREAYEPGDKLTSEIMYEDLKTAREMVKRLIMLNKANMGVVVVLAHEPQRLEEGMPLFPDDVRAWSVEMVEKRRAEESALVKL
ncbi:beta-lactamase-like protein [Irpex rosettiformis]|uniref:Beta-lactamase-like protein n=1 Tax=Irpex rosettiformis TaxID=378272 RepID=A0ACB8UFV0_9APHY|nr:beta-lactamase-like protein [Irpex rosettiformis]